MKKLVKTIAVTFYLIILGGLSACSIFENNSSTAINTLAAPRTDMAGDFDSKTADKRFSPIKGINSDRLFSEKLGGDERTDRLENTVQRIRDDVDEVMPSIKRLVAIETEIEDLVGQLKTLLSEPKITEVNSEVIPNNESELQPPLVNEETNAPTAAPTPLVSADKEETKIKEKKQPENNGKTSIKDLRIGEHADKTRIVIDATAKITTKLDFDNEELLLLIKTDAPEYSFSPQKISNKAKIIDDVTVVKDQNGHEIIISLNAGKSISKIVTIKKDTKNPLYRQYFDIFH
ncbi:MAG: hypothetical protein ACRBB3_08945 [Alphaproteobacteria bacterium]